MDKDAVCDSEGEDEPAQMKFPAHTADKADTTISEFTNNTRLGPEAISTASSRIDTPANPVKARPRPKPAFNKKPAASSSSDHIQGTFSTDASTAAFPGTLSIADRAKMRARPAVKPIEAPEEVIDIVSSDDELALLPQRPAKKARLSEPPSSLAKSSHAADLSLPSITTTESNTSFDFSSPIPMPPKRKRPSVVDDDDMTAEDGPPLFFASSSSLAPPLPEPPKKVKKPRKRNADDEEFGEGNEEAPKKRKPAKPKAKTAPVKKSKGKGKEKEKEPEVYKSSEFVNSDHDDDHDSLFDSMEAPVQDPPSPSLDKVAQASSVHHEKEAERSPSPLSPLLDDAELPPVKDAPKKKSRKRKSAVIEDDQDDLAPPKKKPTPAKQASSSKGKGKGPVLSDDEQEESARAPSPMVEDDPIPPKENIPVPLPRSKSPPLQEETPVKLKHPTLTSRYSIAPRTKATPMSELIRRVNSLPGTAPRAGGASGRVYSPYTKASKSTLSKIAPLHPNRKPPPPPLPPPPPRQKTKKEKEQDEQWEEEIIESVGGMHEWVAMTDAERKEMRRCKREHETGSWED